MYEPVTRTGGVFTEYVNTFLKLKQEASGWPEWCRTESEKQTYIDRYNQKEGILLEYDDYAGTGQIDAKLLLGKIRSEIKPITGQPYR